MRRSRSTITPMTVLPPSKYLNIGNGPGAWGQFLLATTLQFICFAAAGIEFRTGIPTKLPPRPTANDLLDDLFIPNPNSSDNLPSSTTTNNHLNLSTASTIQQPATPFTAPESKTSDVQDDDEVEINNTSHTSYNTLPALIPVPTYHQQFKYRRNTTTNTLSDSGNADLRQDQREWDEILLNLQDLRQYLLEYFLSICHEDSRTALMNHPDFADAVANLQVARLHHICVATHQQNNAVLNINTLFAFLNCSQGDSSLEDFGQDVKLKKTNVAAAFEDPDNAGFIRTSLLTNAVLLRGVNKSMAPLITNLLTAPNSNLHTMTETSILSQFRQFTNNSIAHQQNRQPTTPNNTPKPKPTNNHTTHTAALATPTTNNPKPPNAYTYPSHPHSRPSVTPVGNHTPKGILADPHCPHCVKAGWISNHHGPHTNKPCHDKARFDQDQAQAQQTRTPTPTNTAWNQQAAHARSQQSHATTQANLHAALATPAGQAALSTAYMQGVTNANNAQIDQDTLTRLNTGTAYRGDGSDDHAAGGGADR